MWLGLFTTKSANVKSAYIGDIYAGNTFFALNTYIKVSYLNSACINIPGDVRYLEKYLQSSQISERRLFSNVFETRLEANRYKDCF